MPDSHTYGQTACGYSGRDSCSGPVLRTASSTPPQNATRDCWPSPAENEDILFPFVIHTSQHFTTAWMPPLRLIDYAGEDGMGMIDRVLRQPGGYLNNRVPNARLRMLVFSWGCSESSRSDLGESRLRFGHDAYNQGRHARKALRVAVGNARMLRPAQQHEGGSVDRPMKLD